MKRLILVCSVIVSIGCPQKTVRPKVEVATGVTESPDGGLCLNRDATIALGEYLIELEAIAESCSFGTSL